LIGAEHNGSDSVALVPGHNILYGPGLGTILHRFQNVSGGTIFAYWVASPTFNGVQRGRDSVVARGETGNTQAALRGARTVLLRQRGRRNRALATPARGKRSSRMKSSMPEEVVWRVGFIADEQRANWAHELLKSGYGGYPLMLLDRS
jgi:glucose-1-phosphate thymidylyltransferase